MHDDRINVISEYNKPVSEKFIFLLVTHTGGLSIKLTTADTIVLYASDWYVLTQPLNIILVCMEAPILVIFISESRGQINFFNVIK